MLTPVTIDKYKIYDIFYNDDNTLIIVAPSEFSPYTIYYIDIDGKRIKFNYHKCPHNHTYIYYVSVSYTPTVILSINDEIITTAVNNYPVFKDKILMSTLVKDEDNYIRIWINYHLSIGVDHFIIYDNSEKNTLSTILDDYIKANIVVLIKWNYTYILPISGISGQTTQQNHAIYAFRTSKYIGLMDVDEYVNIQINTLLPDLFNYISINIKDKFGGFTLLQKSFFNPNNDNESGDNFFKITTCNPISKHERQKVFVIPKNVNTFSVHMITSGHRSLTIDDSIIYFNHYMFLNKPGRGKDNSKYNDDSILVHIPKYLKFKDKYPDTINGFQL